MQRTPNNMRSAGLTRWMTQVEAAWKSGNTAEAVRLAREAISKGYVHALLFILRAHGFRTEGRMDAAIADLRRAQDLNPRSLWALNDLADSLNMLGRCAEALAAADAATAVDRKNAQAWFQKGQAHQALRDLDRARDAFLKAVRAEPRFAEAHARLANMAAEQAAPAEAREHALAALSLAPGHPIATLALIAADMAENQADDAERRLGAFLARGDLPPPLRAIAIAQLGDLRDVQGRTGEAFNAYADSRAVWAGFHVPRWAAERREFGSDQVARLAAMLDRLNEQAAHAGA